MDEDKILSYLEKDPVIAEVMAKLGGPGKKVRLRRGSNLPLAAWLRASHGSIPLRVDGRVVAHAGKDKTKEDVF